MQTKNNQIFSQEALERLSSPERLDQMMQVVNPRAWLPLTTIGLLVAVAGTWSVVGRIPISVNGQGVLIQPRRVVQFQARSNGQLMKLNVNPGDVIKKGQEIGVIDKYEIKKELELEKAKLAQLQTQNQDTNKLQKQQITLELQTLRQQQKDLEETLRRESLTPILHQKIIAALEQKSQSFAESLQREEITPILRQQTLAAIAEKRQSLIQRQQQIKNLLLTLQQRFDTRNRLFEQEKAISQDVLLEARREVLDAQMQVSDITSQLKELDVQKTNTEREFLQNLNRINEMKNSIQEIEVQKTNTERDYLQNLNKIDEVKTKIKDLEIQVVKLNQQDLEKSINQTNQIQEVKRKITQLELQLSGESRIISQYDGRILEVSAVPGQVLNPGVRLGSLEAEDPNAKMIGVVYLADKDGKQIKPGMTVQVTPSIVKRERYGGIVGKVTQVSPFPVTSQDIAVIVGNEQLANTLAEAVSKNSALVQVFVELEKDSNTISGYKWSSSNGLPLKISSGTTTQVRIQTGELAPISYVIPIFRSLTGVY
ncbi:NHLP bacteriocin system secretion protein [[Phormidium ambiguum] IAM M-71]|uniref:NHLP bacteriocin system secretion protein n=1 Tax=[Phormidium ambiguum] IAM M-71 TaxID=454136 RepID=A0A1U7I8F1_9CYAN|nr:NHLP bacteriocin system secretion protein [Phormidium ambiguum]OKH32664.1 NHLP bacteriocin system secretion protein [Phormidium ambiguum IAM M-71]